VRSHPGCYIQFLNEIFESKFIEEVQGKFTLIAHSTSFGSGEILGIIARCYDGEEITHQVVVWGVF